MGTVRSWSDGQHCKLVGVDCLDDLRYWPDWLHEPHAPPQSSLASYGLGRYRTDDRDVVAERARAHRKLASDLAASRRDQHRRDLEHRRMLFSSKLDAQERVACANAALWWKGATERCEMYLGDDGAYHVRLESRDWPVGNGHGGSEHG